MIINTRLKLFLICNLSRQKIGSDRGFALPIALMVGMVILVVGATMIIRAQGDQSKIIAQTTSNKAMAIAEAGATRYVDFLNNNRGLIPYDSCAVVNTETGACADDTASTTTTATWVTAKSAVGKLTGIGTGTSPQPVGGTTSCSSSAGGGGTPPPSYQTVDSTTISNTWANAASSGNSSGWRNLPNEQNPEGQYRLVSYKVDRTGNWADPNNPPSNFSATLVVEGRVNVSGTGADAINTGKARVAFTIPVTASTVTGGGSSSGGGFPGLWAQNFNFGNNNSANAQVWDSSACNSGTAMPDAQILNYTNNKNGQNVFPSNPLVLASGVTDTPQANNGNNQLYNGSVYRASSSAANPLPKVMKSQAFPSLPNGGTFPTNSTPALVYGPSTTITGGITENPSVACSSLSNVTFPRSGDVSSTNVAYSGNSNDSETYVYRCSGGMSIGGSDVTLGRTGKETLIFYVNGTFNASANGGVFPVKNSTSNTWSRGVFYVRNDAQVKANGNVGRLLAPFALQFYVYNSGNMNPGFDMGGNGSLYAFVFAPTSIGLSKGTEDLAGALWIKSYEVDGNNKVWQAIFDDTQLMVDLPDGGNVTTYNLDGQPSSWQRASLDTVTVPPVPTGITGTSAVQPSISWTANSTGATPNYYTLFRCQTTSANGTCTPGTPVKAYKQGSSNYSYAESFQPTASQRKFCYAATASNAGGDSARSSVVCGADKT